MISLKRSRKNSTNRIIVVVGPTSGGKSAFAVKLAKKINGEIISADSRQVYKGLNLASGKITKKEMAGIPHHCLDLVSPKTIFTAERYAKCAQNAIKDTMARGKTPIIVGGTGFYIDTALGRMNTAKVPPNWKLRKSLEKKSVDTLFKILKKFAPERSKTVEQKNKRRLIRAIEIAKLTKKKTFNKNQPVSYMIPVDADIVWLGIKTKPEELRKKINNRIEKYFDGMVREIKRLHRNGVSWKRLEVLGLWPKWSAEYVRSRIGKAEALQKLKTETWRYSRRQMTWFRRNKKIRWILFHKEFAI